LGRRDKPDAVSKGRSPISKASLETDGGPEHAEAAQGAGEVLTWERAGRTIEPRNQPRLGCRRREAVRNLTGIPIRRSTPKVRVQCGSRTHWDLCGGRS
jgi:hypothetical protein